MKAKMAPLFMDTASKGGSGNDKDKDGSNEARTSRAGTVSRGKGSGDNPAEFWDLLLKLDTASSSRKVRHSLKFL